MWKLFLFLNKRCGCDLTWFLVWCKFWEISVEKIMKVQECRCFIAVAIKATTKILYAVDIANIVLLIHYIYANRYTSHVSGIWNKKNCYLTIWSPCRNVYNINKYIWMYVDDDKKDIDLSLINFKRYIRGSKNMQININTNRFVNKH